MFAQLLAERDIILYDQRGVGLSEPALCRSLDTVMARLPLQGLSRAAFTEQKRSAFARCAAEMSSKGVDLSQYNTVASALDLRDLRVALDVREWNVYSGSYGARLTLEAMRTAPEGIRAVVLDSPSPPNASIWTDNPAIVASVLAATFSRCASDPACAAAFPDAEGRFWRNVETLEREPLVLRTRAADGSRDSIRVTGTLLVGAVFQGLYSSHFHGVLPLLTREVDKRNRDLLSNVAQALQMPPGTISNGLYWTVECNEVAPLAGRSTFPVSHADRAALMERLGVGSLGDACDALHPFRAGPERAEPVTSDLPVLLFTGRLDPVTPPAYARLAAGTLQNARVVEVPGAGHGESPRHDCTQRLTREFLVDPAAPLDVACADSIQPPPFVTDVRLTPGVARIASMFTPASSPVVLGGVAAPLLVLLSAVLVSPAAGLWTRVRRRPRPAVSLMERRARLGALGVATLSLAFLAALAFTVSRTVGQNPFVLALGLPASAAPLLLVPWLLSAGSVWLVVTAALAWRRSDWTRWGRIHFTLVAAASVLVSAALFVLGLV
jgi:pimeloyl-ACP methyl ester carboxylesterase